MSRKLNVAFLEKKWTAEPVPSEVSGAEGQSPGA
eukprot:CAMPEP_0197678212 /NCGR_PEP_ID=MMETSP1338-20131121/89657_1 /TAXON_ID=43686 ORGANISM="Pelagodinium beii, Strain RCC1491" /NCGR_SAMPLE_ID=MMETSP1338 /ASSEMBLY_ACC=CAM_ASM_000754 /LENGTH=33 /DNA_ID= /DNA_START= /DNA_END= /DNA_ORIENTATION=